MLTHREHHHHRDDATSCCGTVTQSYLSHLKARGVDGSTQIAGMPGVCRCRSNPPVTPTYHSVSGGIQTQWWGPVRFTKHKEGDRIRTRSKHGMVKRGVWHQLIQVQTNTFLCCSGTNKRVKIHNDGSVCCLAIFMSWKPFRCCWFYKSIKQKLQSRYILYKSSSKCFNALLGI